MRAREAAIASILVAGWSTGCASVGAFECLGDADCDRHADGVCMAGACAYPSDACDGGLAWSPNAPEDPGACLPEPSTGSTTTSTSASTSGSDTESTSTSASSSVSTSTSADTSDATASGPVPTCGQRKSIEIDTTVISASVALVDYPLLLSLSDAELVDADPEGMFFTDEGGETIPHELETFDPTTGSLLGWVRLPTWTVGETVTLVLVWGDPADAPAPSPGQVWSPTFVGVWHLGDALDDSEGEVVRNAVAGGEHGFAYGGMSSDQSVAGAIGSGLLFDADDDYVEVSAAFVGSLQAFTVSYWSRWDGATEAGGYFSRLNGEPLYPRCWKVANSGNPYCQLRSSGEVVGTGGDPQRADPGELVHMVFSWDGTEARTYFAGQLANANAQYPGEMEGGDRTLFIGRGVEFGTFNGMLDEFRVSDRALPAEWILADYRTQSNPANAILDVGAAEPRPCE